MADLENTLHLEIADADGKAKGKIVIGLRPDVAPLHVARIKELAREGFYDGVVFHRVIEGFMAQGGDPTGTGMGGSKKPDLKAEFSSEPHTRGVCSMARSSNPNSANSQFFICFGDAGFLDRQYTVWGKVTEGMDVVDAIKRGEPVRGPDKIATMRVAADVAVAAPAAEEAAAKPAAKKAAAKKAPAKKAAVKKVAAKKAPAKKAAPKK